MQSKLIRMTAGMAVCSVFLLALNVAAQCGEARDHRSGASGGGVQVTNTPPKGSGSNSTVRDHRTKPVVRDHRKPIVCVKGPFDGSCQ